MAEIVLRVWLIGGDRMDVTYDEPQALEPAQVIEHVIATLTEYLGAIRTGHGDRLVVLRPGGLPPLRWRHAARSSDLQAIGHIEPETIDRLGR